jgi:hypothetical protein
MLKSLGVICVLVLGLVAYVFEQDEHALESHRAKTLTHVEDGYKPDRDTPPWYRLFRWPEGATTWAVILTLAAIALQTKETARAANASVETVNQSKAQIAEMQKQIKDTRNKERARISIFQISPPHFDQPGRITNDINQIATSISMRVVIDGLTDAFNVSARGLLQVVSNPKEVGPLGHPLKIPTVIRRSENTASFPITGTGKTLDPSEGGSNLTSISVSDKKDVDAGTRNLRVVGSIDYEDVCLETITPFLLINFGSSIKVLGCLDSHVVDVGSTKAHEIPNIPWAGTEVGQAPH